MAASTPPRQRRSRPARRPSGSSVRSGPQRRRGRPQRRWLWLAASASLLVLAAGLLLWLFSWSRQPGPGTGRIVSVRVDDTSRLSVSRLMAEHGLVSGSYRFAAYLWLFEHGASVEPGEHLLVDSLSPRELTAQLARRRNRSRVRVTLLEGWTHRDIGQRLEASGVCTAAAFREAFADRALLDRLGIDANTAEGYLFPDTYEMLRDSEAAAVLTTLVLHAERELEQLRSAHSAGAEKMAELLGFSEYQWLTLASIVEKEARSAEELPEIASVFYNRLTDPDFRPERMLQSDPTAAYGCLIEPERAPSCQGFRGKVRPEMLRDAANRYNTYRHAGLPPGPIGNPGTGALRAVLEPAETDFLFFFADGHGSHTFTRTFDEHRKAIRERQNR